MSLFLPTRRLLTDDVIPVFSFIKPPQKTKSLERKQGKWTKLQLMGDTVISKVEMENIDKFAVNQFQIMLN